MSQPIVPPYPTGPEAKAAAVKALNPMGSNMIGSRILGIATQVRDRQAEGADICNLTIGDFSPAHFQAPEPLRAAIQRFVGEGHTNYPPADGILELRQAIAGFYERRLGLAVPMEAIVVGSGARPPLYATYMLLLEPGDELVYAVPSWNNEYYAYLNGAEAVLVPTTPEDGFMPTLESLRPHLRTARILHLNSPLNPCGTCIDPDELKAICEAIVAENARREGTDQRPLFLLYDMVYWMLTYGDTQHADPISLCPAIAPTCVYIDAISKNFAGTGLRVGWGVVPPHIQGKFKALIGHVGAWAPRPEQMATAWLLERDEVIDAWLDEFRPQLEARLNLIHQRFSEMAAAGLPVRAIAPQGAIYLSIQVDLVGRSLPDGGVIETNEQIRLLLLDGARTAVVPFRAFGLEVETGWFRMSIGAVGMDELAAALDRVEATVREVCAVS